MAQVQPAARMQQQQLQTIPIQKHRQECESRQEWEQSLLTTHYCSMHPYIPTRAFATNAPLHAWSAQGQRKPLTYLTVPPDALLGGAHAGLQLPTCRTA
jgi:hypothetical protein